MRMAYWSLAAAIVAIAAGVPALALGQCAADNERRVSAKGECLAIHTARPEAASRPPTNLVVVVHGDHSEGGPVRSTVRFARELGFEDTVAVAILRPGYADADNNSSSGNNYQRVDSYTAHNIDAVAAAIAALKAHHKPARTVLVGHSGGAAFTGVILGRHPGLVDGALLLSCPCNLQKWRVGKREWSRSESPHRYVGSVPNATQVKAITARDDDNTFPALGADYVEALKQRQVRAEFATIPAGGHNGTLAAPETKAALRALLDNMK